MINRNFAEDTEKTMELATGTANEYGSEMAGENLEKRSRENRN